MKRKRTARKPKAQRTSLDKQIATAPALPSKDCLGIPNKLSVLFADYDFGRPHSKAEELVFLHFYLRLAGNILEQATDATLLAEMNDHFLKAGDLLEEAASAFLPKNTWFYFIWDVLTGYHPEKLTELARDLTELAREMKRGLKRRIPQRDPKPLLERLVLLDASAGGPVDFAELARMITDQESQVAAKHGLLSAKQLQDRKTEKALSKARSLRRIAHRIGVPTRTAGRPKKSDT